MLIYLFIVYNRVLRLKHLKSSKNAITLSLHTKITLKYATKPNSKTIISSHIKQI